MGSQWERLLRWRACLCQTTCSLTAALDGDSHPSKAMSEVGWVESRAREALGESNMWSPLLHALYQLVIGSLAPSVVTVDDGVSLGIGVHHRVRERCFDHVRRVEQPCKRCDLCCVER